MWVLFTSLQRWPFSVCFCLCDKFIPRILAVQKQFELKCLWNCIILLRLGAWLIAIFLINFSMTSLVNIFVAQGELVGTPLSMSGDME